MQTKIVYVTQMAMWGLQLSLCPPSVRNISIQDTWILIVYGPPSRLRGWRYPGVLPVRGEVCGSRWCWTIIQVTNFRVAVSCTFHVLVSQFTVILVRFHFLLPFQKPSLVSTLCRHLRPCYHWLRKYFQIAKRWRLLIFLETISLNSSNYLFFAWLLRKKQKY